jgi:hypothetical protein
LRSPEPMKWLRKLFYRHHILYLWHTFLMGHTANIHSVGYHLNGTVCMYVCTLSCYIAQLRCGHQCLLAVANTQLANNLVHQLRRQPASHDGRLGVVEQSWPAKQVYLRTKSFELNNSIFYIGLYCINLLNFHTRVHLPIMFCLLQYCIGCKDKWGESGYIHPQASQTVQLTINDVLQQEKMSCVV